MKDMTRTTLLLVAMLVLPFGTACSDNSDQSEPDPDANIEIARSDLERNLDPNIDPADLETQVEGNTDFALKLYRASTEDADENLIASPYSVSLALAMTHAGARGQTEADMASVMEYRLAQDELHPVFNHLDLLLESRGKGAQGQDDEPFRLRIANSVWGDQNVEFKQPFLDTLALNYGAGLRIVDFLNNADPSRVRINDWVEQKTEGRIQDVLPQGSITRDTVLVLVNAIYFNAAWASTFEESATQPGDFTLTDDSTVTADMMNQMSTFEHASLEDLEAIELMYDGDEVSMLILVPDDLETLESTLDAQTLANIDADLGSKMVDLSMPKFEIESEVKVGRILKELGMQSAFEDADFTGISDIPLAISDIFHKAFINLDENGTEAAAATAVVVGPTSAPIADVELSIDRPFMYLIRDVETKTVLFIGRVTDPS